MEEREGIIFKVTYTVGRRPYLSSRSTGWTESKPPLPYGASNVYTEEHRGRYTVNLYNHSIEPIH